MTCDTHVTLDQYVHEYIDTYIRMHICTYIQELVHTYILVEVTEFNFVCCILCEISFMSLALFCLLSCSSFLSCVFSVWQPLILGGMDVSGIVTSYPLYAVG